MFARPSPTANHAVLRKGTRRNLALVALTCVLALMLTACLNVSSRADSDERRSLAEAGGCFDAVVEPVDEAPPVDVAEIEDEVRQYMNDLVASHGQPLRVGELVWAEYGRLVSGGESGQPFPAAGNVRWALVFDLEMDDGQTATPERRAPNRWSILYAAEDRQVGSACGGRV